MNPFIWLILTIIQIYIWVVIATVIMSWLLAFNVVNMQNNFVRQVSYVLAQLTEPLLEPIRRYTPEPRRARHLAAHPAPPAVFPAAADHLLHARRGDLTCARA